MFEVCKQTEAYSSSSSPSSFTTSSTSSLAVTLGAFFFLVPLAFFSGTASSSLPSSEAVLPLRPFLALLPSASSVLRFCGKCQ
jgi:hypothetical protein